MIHLQSMEKTVITEEKIRQQLDKVMDPELHMSITDLGLVYRIDIEKENSDQEKADLKVHILMTLTTIGCPLFPVIEHDIKSKLSDIGIDEHTISIEVTFDPPWDMERMSERAKAILGI